MWLKKPYIKHVEITSPFGERIHPITKKIKLHTGVDLGMPSGTKLFAPMDGEVISGVDKGGYGNYLILEAITKQSTRIQFLFGHLKKVLKKGKVTAWEEIALSGNSGSSTGAHLHFEIRIWDGQKYSFENPINYIDFA